MTACCRFGSAALVGIAALFSTTIAASAANHDAVTGPSWTGFYIGGFLGAGDVTHRVTTGLLPGISYDGLGGEGIFGGLMGGYNHQVTDRIVLGVQGEFAFSGISSDFSIAIPGLGSATAKLEEQYSAAISGRLGWLSNPDTMLYLIGGYSHARYKGSASRHARKAFTAIIWARAWKHGSRRPSAREWNTAGGGSPASRRQLDRFLPGCLSRWGRGHRQGDLFSGSGQLRRCRR